jgi:anti-anti-sigma regulatory factor
VSPKNRASQRFTVETKIKGDIGFIYVAGDISFANPFQQETRAVLSRVNKVIVNIQDIDILSGDGRASLLKLVIEVRSRQGKICAVVNDSTYSAVRLMGLIEFLHAYQSEQEALDFLKMPAAARLQARFENGVAVIRVHNYSAPEDARRFKELTTETLRSYRKVIINVADIDFFFHESRGQLAALANELRQKQGQLSVVLTARVQKLFESDTFNRFAHWARTEHEALEYMIYGEKGPPPKLLQPNVPKDWQRSQLWRKWEAPLHLVRGERYYQQALRQLAGPPRVNGYLRPVAVDLVREPANRYDPDAIRAEIGGQLIGHLAKELAANLSPQLDRADCRVVTSPGVIRGGSWDRPALVVHLWPRRQLSPAPEFEVAEEARYWVPWPPTPDEGQIHES